MTYRTPLDVRICRALMDRDMPEGFRHVSARLLVARANQRQRDSASQPRVGEIPPTASVERFRAGDRNGTRSRR